MRARLLLVQSTSTSIAALNDAPYVGAGVIPEETDPEELLIKATVRSSVLEVLLEIIKFCDLYLMERVVDGESEKKVLLALEYAGVFASGGLVNDKVLFCSTENGRSSFLARFIKDYMTI
ncbi:hypothetical protein MLD38_033394 [Melastoma candidum]|uniref:Uncharacterized protein n=1 Tax=Melastoma candidum TaxID=119954 RepID=A0ACB9M8F3_9MYRT|nr:hypothetical protein MLD38_033394 [Melastoma candidum]